MDEVMEHDAILKDGEEPSSEAVKVPASYVPQQLEGVTAIDMGDGLVLYNPDSSLVHHLNPSAAIVWHLCQGDASLAELAVDIGAQYGVSPALIQGELATLIGELDALGLVWNAGEPSA